MSEAFTLEAFQNRHLPPGTTRVDAIVTATAPGRATAGATAAPGAELVVGFIVDKSGSMSGQRIGAVKSAVAQAILKLDRSASFFLVVFDAAAALVIPPVRVADMHGTAIGHALDSVRANGGTAMSTGLALARQVFQQYPNAIRQAVFLTDGKNESEAATAVRLELRACAGLFECDCWGVGTDWQVGEVQEIAQGLLGKASLVPDPAGVAEAFARAMTKASGKAFKDVRLRMWTPQGAQVVFVKQVNPTIEELTNKAKMLSPQVREFATGAWGAGETRDFHVAIEVRGGKVNDEMLAGRPSIAYFASEGGAWGEKEDKPADGRLFAKWTADDALSSKIDRHVAHYTGQDELAHAIVEGLEQREKGNEAAATQLLGKAVQIAHTSGNAEMTQRLAKVVDIVEATTGTIKLKKDVKKASAMDLQLESRTTKRVARKSEP